MLEVYHVLSALLLAQKAKLSKIKAIVFVDYTSLRKDSFFCHSSSRYYLSLNPLISPSSVSASAESSWLVAEDSSDAAELF